MKLRTLLSLFLICLSMIAAAQTAPEKPDPVNKSVEELRHAHGAWTVTTEFLKPDGSVARALNGTYRFSWVIPDRVLTGQSDIPELKQQSAILFYVNERRKLIEMVSVGADGNLWVMTGEAGSDARTTKPFPTADGKTSQLRFTRYNVKPDSFESKMEYTEDGGKTWLPGNRQTFQRSK
jgi:hypothetical protein